MESGSHLDEEKLPIKGSENIPIKGLLNSIQFILLNISCSCHDNWKINLFGENFRILKSHSFIRYKNGKIASRHLYGKTFAIHLMSFNGKKNGLFMLLVLLRAGDVEKNPGPVEMTLMTQNCRGLKNRDKIKQLVNRLQKFSSSVKIFALQETHLEESTLKYSWSGNLAITPSVGSKGGVITLLSSNVNILDQIDIENEAHVLNVEILNNKETNAYIVVNLHSPCAHDHIKISFFEKITSVIQNLIQSNDESEIILLGDFNTTFDASERNNTTRSRKEVNCANKITDMLEEFNLTDCWTNNETRMTWRHGDKMSRIDRIKWSTNVNVTHVSTTTDWSITTSDHAAVITNLKPVGTRRIRSQITRIDTTFMHNAELRHKFTLGVDEHMSQLRETNLDPHGRLEFLKMSIRSVAIEIATNYRKEREAEFNEIKAQINFWQTTYENAKEQGYKDLAQENLDTMIAKRDNYLAVRGKFLSERSRSKWYQEGEKSNKYFLNLNRARNNMTEMTELKIDNVLSRDVQKINKTVQDFYVKLYEKGDSKRGNKTRLNLFLEGLQKVSPENATKACSNLTPEDLMQTLKTCPDSAPGPDGIPYSVIKLTWKHFGTILTESWAHAQKTGQLPPSHESSYLRLLPKEGKDVSELKNWRPITLSNCDFKLITKTLSRRLTEAVTNVIGPHQTAYIKQRQISDNLQVMQYTLEHANNSMIMSLDAEKAFDSLEHWYIKEVLSKVGLKDFISIFELIYKNQVVDIILNGNKAGNYKIKNGVKQGDALSCILFILGVEPVLQKINDDNLIKGIEIDNCHIPKALAYADDIACITAPDKISIQRIFNHYDVLTSVSGLKLNADKTEIISNGGPDCYEVWYNDSLVKLDICNQTKINGLILNYNLEEARSLNIKLLLDAVKSQLGGWCKRNLSILGKIQIFKTFGLSQILYKLSVITMDKSEEKKLTDIIYKFIWNRDMNANKAPDRIKRQILATKTKELGFGMLDYKEVVNSLRVKNTLRLLNLDCPFSTIIKSNIMKSLFNIQTIRPITYCINEAIKLIKINWKETLKNSTFTSMPELKSLLQNEYVGNLVNPKYKKNKVIRQHRDDTIWEILNDEGARPILKKLDPHVYNYLSTCTTPLTADVKGEINYTLFPIKGKLKMWNKITSKALRQAHQTREPLIPKLLLNAKREDLINLGSNISYLTNSRLKCILLRCIHGDIFCKERMFRFGMTEDDKCPRCDKIESINHMLLECDYIKNLWDLISRVTGIKINSLHEILGLDPKHDKVTMTIHAETIRRILSVERPIVNPNMLITSIVKNIHILEKGVTKYQTGAILEYIKENFT